MLRYGPPKTIYNRFIRWSRLGVFNRIFVGLATEGGKPDQPPPSSSGSMSPEPNFHHQNLDLSRASGGDMPVGRVAINRARQIA